MSVRLSNIVLANLRAAQTPEIPVSSTPAAPAKPKRKGKRRAKAKIAAAA